MSRYLLVDDNAPFVENVAEILREDGHEVAIAHDGGEALVEVQRTRFDAIVSDLQMPKMDGAQLLSELGALDPDVPVVMLTAYGSDERLRGQSGKGPFAVIPKPPRMDELLSVLAGARRASSNGRGER